MPPAEAEEAAPAPRPWWRWLRLLWLLPVLLWVIVAAWHATKSMPPGTHLAGPWMELPAGDVSFIADITAADAFSRPVMSQAIFDESLKIISQAREILVLDYHLFGDLHATKEGRMRPLGAQLRDALIARRRQLPHLTVLLITDPVNQLHGEASSFELKMLAAAGIQVVVTDTNQLRDGNFVYSPLWRLGIRWWADPQGEGWLPDPTGSGETPVTFGAWAQLLNFKANQRRVILGDDGQGNLLGIIGSADPHEASSQYSNVALRIKGPVLGPLLASELAIARFSGWHGAPPRLGSPAAGEEVPLQGAPPTDPLRVQILTEGAIGEALMARIRATRAGDAIDIATLYLTDRNLIVALLEAARRGVNVRLILDPGKDGFGRVRTGLPNQSVASELVSTSDGAIHVRWYRTHGEQFHARFVKVHSGRHEWLLVGSADLTRHALDDYHLEADVAVEMSNTTALAVQTQKYFDTLWNNRAGAGIEYTADFAVYADPAQSHYWLYRFLEGTGLAPF